jgi:hypothetical protein
MQFNIEHFIDKFSQIPDEMIKVSTETNSYDAWEWCTPGEAKDLGNLISHLNTTLLEANDGVGDWAGVTHKSPKERILLFLKIVKKVQDECRKAI